MISMLQNEVLKNEWFTSVHSADRLKTRSSPSLCQAGILLVLSAVRTTKRIPVRESGEEKPAITSYRGDGGSRTRLHRHNSDNEYVIK